MKTGVIKTKPNFTVGYVSPGWPLKDFPNGIVAYIENIIVGLDEKIQPIIFARFLKDFTETTDVINLSNFNDDKSPPQQLIDKVLYKIKLPFAKSLIYKRTASYLAQNQKRAMQSLASPVDIIEMEESFGFADVLMKISVTPVVVRLHGPNFLVGPYIHLHQDADFKLKVLHEGNAIKNAHGVTSPSLDVLDRVRKYYGISLPNAKVIPNPVSAVSANNQWKYKVDKKPSILFVGRFDSVKGGDLILEAFRLIALAKTEAVLYFVGPDNGIHLKDEVVKFDEFMEKIIPEDNIKSVFSF